jgi:hypothetical protein
MARWGAEIVPARLLGELLSQPRMGYREKHFIMT